MVKINENASCMSFIQPKLNINKNHNFPINYPSITNTTTRDIRIMIM